MEYQHSLLISFLDYEDKSKAKDYDWWDIADC